jgi:hypothetical protein
MRYLASAVGLAFLLSFTGSAYAQCYVSNCRTDADGTVWCYNQEIPCPVAQDENLSPYEVSEGQPLNTSWPTATTTDCVGPDGNPAPCSGEECITCRYQIQLSEPAPACGQSCSFRYGLPEDRVPPPEYTGEVGGLQGSGSLRGLPNDTFYGNRSDWYSISEPSIYGPFDYWPY